MRTDASAALPPLIRLLLAGACTVVILAGIKAVAPILSTFLIAMLIAEAISPIMHRLIRRGWPQGFAIGVTLLLVTVGGALVITMVAMSINELLHRLPDYADRLAALRTQALGVLSGWGVDTTSLLKLDALNPSEVLGPAARIAGTVLADVGHGFFMLLITALLLIEIAVIHKAIAAVPAGQRSFLVRIGEMSADLQKYLGISAFVGVVGAVLYMILLMSLGVPFVATWVVLYFIFSFIPVIGGIISIIPAVAVTLMEYGPQRAIILTVVFAVGNFLLGDLLKPRIMQKGFEISIVAVFFSLVFWNWLLGPIGMVLAVPITITFRKLLQEFEGDVRKAVLE